jgi:hypothetical protein
MTLDASELYGFPQKQCEETGKGYCCDKHIPVVNVLQISCLWDSLKTTLKECVKAKLRC